MLYHIHCSLSNVKEVAIALPLQPLHHQGFCHCIPIAVLLSTPHPHTAIAVLQSWRNLPLHFHLGLDVVKEFTNAQDKGIHCQVVYQRNRPRENPGKKPAKILTNQPMEQLSRQPTEQPTKQPTKQLTEQQTEEQSKYPSKNPYENPTDQPMEQPIEDDAAANSQCFRDDTFKLAIAWTCT